MKRRPRRFPIVIAALIGIGGAIATFILLRPDPAAAVRGEPTATKRIKDVGFGAKTGAVARSSAAVAKKPKKVEYWEQDTTNGLSACQILKWELYHTPAPSYTNNYIHHQPRPFYAIFDHSSENEIACLLTMNPGEGLVGEPNYGKDWAEDFEESCKVPIIISSADSEETKQLKQMMIDAKIELKNRMAAGEDICRIMADTRNELMRLGQIRESMVDQVRELIDETARSSADVDDMVDAANKLLEQKGIAPISLNPLTRRMICKNLGIPYERKKAK